MLEGTRAIGPSVVQHEVKPYIARGTWLVRGFSTVLDDETMLTPIFDATIQPKWVMKLDLVSDFLDLG